MKERKIRLSVRDIYASASSVHRVFACIFLSVSIHIGHFLMFLMRWPLASGLWPLRRSRPSGGWFYPSSFGVPCSIFNIHQS